MSANGIGYELADRAAGLAHYPHARRVGGLLFISGISSRRFEGGYDGVTENADGTCVLDIRLQTKAVLENIRAILKESINVGLEALVDLTVFLVDMSDYTGMNEVYNQFFESKTGPTRTTVGVKQLPSPKLLIEIKAVAACP